MALKMREEQLFLALVVNKDLVKGVHISLQNCCNASALFVAGRLGKRTSTLHIWSNAVVDKGKNAVVLLAHGPNRMARSLFNSTCWCARNLAFKESGVNVTELQDLLHRNATSNKLLLGVGNLCARNILEVTGKVLANSLDVLAVIEALKVLGDKSFALLRSLRDRCVLCLCLRGVLASCSFYCCRLLITKNGKAVGAEDCFELLKVNAFVVAAFWDGHKASHGLQTAWLGNLGKAIFCHEAFNNGILSANLINGFA